MKKIALTAALVLATVSAALGVRVRPESGQPLSAGGAVAAAGAGRPQRRAGRPAERHRPLAKPSTARRNPSAGGGY